MTSHSLVTVKPRDLSLPHPYVSPAPAPGFTYSPVSNPLYVVSIIYVLTQEKLHTWMFDPRSLSTSDDFTFETHGVANLKRLFARLSVKMCEAPCRNKAHPVMKVDRAVYIHSTSKHIFARLNKDPAPCIRRTSIMKVDYIWLPQTDFLK